MGWFNFKWDHPADEVSVAGSFTNWEPTVKLEKTGTVHEKSVDIPATSEKILYKFVVDGVWKHDHTGKTETDHEGNVNNVLYPSDIKPHGILQSILSSVAPSATTASMAGQQPLENSRAPVESTPGAFPETPAAGLEEKKEDQAFSVNPIPASEGAGNPITLAPGEKVPQSSTVNSNTLTSGVHDDPELKSQQTEQTFGVAPIPATGGIGNPVHLQPGEKVPDASTLTGNTIGSNVKLDQASYEKGDSGAPVLPPVLTPQGEKEAAGEAAIFTGLGPQTTNLIPESSMGIGNDAPAPLEGAAISSVGAPSTTNQLAGQVPLEPRGVPEVVSESQQEAHAAPEASANPTAVSEKTQVENELKSKVPEEKATTDSNNGTILGAVAGGLAGVGAAAGAALAYTTSSKENQKPTDSKGVPEVVSESQQEAHASPEASANPIAVSEKKDVENELKAKVPEEKATSDNTILGAVTGGIAGVGAAAGAALGYNSKENQKPTESKGVPEVVTESQEKANAAPEASANPAAVEDKKDVESELKSKIPEEKPTTSTGGIVGAVTGGVAVAGTAAAGAAIALNSKAKETTGTDVVSTLPTSVQKTIHDNAKNSDLPPATQATVSTVPTEVTDSQKQAHVAPEASANPEAVVEKTAAEKELLSKVPESQATGQPAPTATAATSATAPVASTASSGAPQLADPVGGGLAPINMDKELNAPADSQAQTPATRVNELAAQADSRDVSPMSKPVTTGQTQPTATTGVDSTTIPSTSKPVGTPRTGASTTTPTKRNSIMDRFKGTPESSTKTPDSEGKKKGFFSKIKEKLKH